MRPLGRACSRIFIILSCISVSKALQELYRTARAIRIERGAAAAVPFYQDVLSDNPSDKTTATHLAASASAAASLDQVCLDTAHVKELRQLLDECNYTTHHILQDLQISSTEPSSIGPIFVAPVAAGTVTSWPWGDDRPPSPLECLIALFLVGLVVPRSVLTRSLSTESVDLLLDSHLLASSETQPDNLFALVQIFPLSLFDHPTLYLMTDWHPRVLSQTSIQDGDDAVMYIGPDSLALVQHYLMDDERLPSSISLPQVKLLDLCTGSGIEALAALVLGKCDRAVCLDVNPRCLRFARFNAALNGVIDRVDFVCGDLIEGVGYTWNHDSAGMVLQASQPLVDLLHSEEHRFEIITANPPFLPVPPSLPAHRHGLFSSGGGTGEIVLASIVQLASSMLSKNGTLAIVSEFFLADGGSARPLLDRIQQWSSDSGSGETQAELEGILLTNEVPLTAETYAERRSDSSQEQGVWLNHLTSQGIQCASPGLLYLRRRTDRERRCEPKLKHILVPKTTSGSVWGPFNWDAVAFTRTRFHDFFTDDDNLQQDS